MTLQQENIRKKIRRYKKQRRTKVLQLYGLFTARMRMLPDFIIVGSQRSGTTSLYNYLAGHPFISPAVVKEIHYFDLAFHKGMNWYRGNFPMLPSHNGDQKIITGEASPYYAFHPHAPKRIASLFPSMKIIILMRNPVDRAYSHYQHEVQLGFEDLSFEEAINQENARLSGEIEKMTRDDGYSSFNHRHFSYISRGEYILQAQNLTALFPREQILFIKSEDFFVTPQQTLSQILSFLALPDWNFSNFKVHNQLKYQGMKAATRNRLIAHFEPFNQALYSLLGADLGWDS